jgi:mRNA interferase MazF
MVSRGEVWWMDLPAVGRRPACFLTRDAAIAALRSVLVAPATRTIRGIPTEVPLSPADGMPAECVLSCDNLVTVPKVLLTERITRLEPSRMPELCAALRVATGC